MSSQQENWIQVADVRDIPDGEAKPVQIGSGRSIALFNQEGKIYATDNQCPHMGYPLTRGVVRSGILTCDWHGRNFDLEGGGCFNYECDDLETFPVETRDNEIWVKVGDFAYRRKAEHLRLLWEGLLSQDRWTMSKAIALLLRGGVAEEEIIELILRHLGRHIASERGSDGGWNLSRLINGLKVARRYTDADRLITITTAACSAAGPSSERLEVVSLPQPVTWESIERWVGMFSHDGHSGRIERCLFTAHQNGDQEKILPLLFECTVEPHFLGFPDNIVSIGHLSEVIDEFGWEKGYELVCNLGAKLAGRGRGEPERFRRDAVRIMRSHISAIDQFNPYNDANESASLDEDAFVSALTSANIQNSFDCVNKVLRSGVKIDRIITSLVFLAADRMARTPLNVDAGWPCLTAELNLAASLRRVQKIGGDFLAAKGIYHAAWLIFENRWLNILSRPLSEPLGDQMLDAQNEDEGVELIINAIGTLNVKDVGDQVLAYLNAGYCGHKLLEAIGKAVLWNDTASEILPTLHTVFQEWESCNGDDPALGYGHPAHYQLLVGLARYATDIRTNKDSLSATTTAIRFAEGKTTVEVFAE